MDAKYVFVWADRRIRSKLKALEAFPTVSESFMPSQALDEFADFATADGRWSIDQDSSVLPGRFLVLLTARSGSASAMAWIARECQDRRLVLFDPEGERIVTDPVRSMNNADDPIIEVVRDAVAKSAALGSTDAVSLDLAVREAVGGVPGDTLLPGPVPLGFRVDPALSFLVPIAIPDRRQTPGRLATYLAEIADPKPNVRRAAATDLGGWRPSPEVDAALQLVATTDSDGYVRAVALLSLTARRSASRSHVEAVVREFSTGGDNPFAPLAATIIGFAAVVAAKTGQISMSLARRIIDELPSTPAENERRRALASMLDGSS